MYLPQATSAKSQAGLAVTISQKREDSMREPDLEIVNRTLSVTIQKQEKEIARLRRELLTAADNLKIAGWHRASEMARDAAQ